MKIFEYRDYKLFLTEWLKNHPQGGRGQIKKMAEHLSVSTTLLSQVLRADKHFSLETAAEIADYIGLRENESEYFVLLVEHQRAGAFKLKQILYKKLLREQEAGSEFQNRLQKAQQLTDTDKMQYYSSWMYSGARILSALPEIKNANDIADRLGLPLKAAHQVLHFLLEKGLCVQQKNKISYGPQMTHISHDSPYVSKHHQNWRVQGFQHMELHRDEDFFYSLPMALSKDAAEKITAMLPKFVEEILAISIPSDSEVVRCFGLDWFEF